MDLLTNLMEWSRSQTGRMVFNPINFDLVGFLADIVPMFDDIAGQKSITIRRDLPPKMSVSADQAMISTVFRNLISNAIKFTKPGGTITLSVIQNANEIMVSVRDTGIGIPDTMIGKLFQIDQCYSTPGTNREQGTGLGLILCKEFVEKHGGKIWAESEEGKGSVFFFTLKTNN
jgi:signal transduction histidine kinase